MFLIYNRCSALVVSAAIVALTVTGAPVRAEESFTPQSEAASDLENFWNVGCTSGCNAGDLWF